MSLSEPHTRESGGENSVCTCMLACIRQISRANCRFKNVRVSILDCNNYSLVPYPPSLTPLFHGHIIDTVHLLLVLKRGEVPLDISGGKGHQVFNSSRSQNLSDNLSSLLLWAIRDYKFNFIASII